jgi:hypothetical protein
MCQKRSALPRTGAGYSNDRIGASLDVIKLQQSTWGICGTVWYLFLDIRIKRWRHFDSNASKYRQLHTVIKNRLAVTFQIRQLNQAAPWRYAKLFVLDRRSVAKERRPLSQECIIVFLGGSRPQAAATGCYRAAPRGRATEPPSASRHIRVTPPAAGLRSPRCQSSAAPGSPKSINPKACIGLLPDRFQITAVLGPVEAWPGSVATAERSPCRPAFDSPCARLLSTIAGRGEETGFQAEQRN